MLPFLIADSGGTKTDWCFVDSSNKKHFFSTESYHPVNWTKDFEQNVKRFWDEFPEYKKAELRFFCAGCLKQERSDELTQMFKRIGFVNVKVLSDLHGAAISLYGKTNGYCAILGTGSVFFEWKDQEVRSITGGKGHELGDEGSGFYFGKLVYEAYSNHSLSDDQTRLFEKEFEIKEFIDSLEKKNTKNVFSSIPERLAKFKKEFENIHLRNIDLFFDDVWKSNLPLNVKVVGGYFKANSDLFIPYLKRKGIHIQDFNSRPIDSLVDYFVRFDD